MSKKFVFTTMFCALLASQNACSMFSSISSISNPGGNHSDNPTCSIFKAVEKRDKASLEYFLGRGCNYSPEGNNDEHIGGTPLMYAVSLGYHEIVEVLVKYGADINVLRVPFGKRQERTPLEIAFEKGDLSIVKCLVKKGAFVQKDWYKEAFKTKDGKVSQAAAKRALSLVLAGSAKLSDRIIIIKYILKEVKAGKVDISSRDLLKFMKNAKDADVKWMFFSDCLRRRRQKEDSKWSDFLTKDMVSKLIESQNDAEEKIIAAIQEKSEERDNVLISKGVKKGTAKGYLTSRSIYYTLWGNLDKELELINNKKESIQNELKAMLTKKQVLKKRMKELEKIEIQLNVQHELNAIKLKLKNKKKKKKIFEEIEGEDSD